jgi:tetratricopeptide (TPR) repeat protein
MKRPLRCSSGLMSVLGRVESSWDHRLSDWWQRAISARGLGADPEAYAPLVNLGGVLINLAKWDEALTFYRRAVLKNPSDALADSQLGMAYFYSGQLDAAEKHLTEAKRIDPAHFSHP